ncbi:hypothetical protein V5O48_003707 [Marasmius crinis-equi]|uniref:Uncharacterized protein n=1 Tax=Marasmius crinis-equi TaxID=585013 RepID=A0ABR3FS58_9AGAR
MISGRFPYPDANQEQTPTFQARAESSSEAASLHGQKAKTPIIAGTICGVVLGLAWFIGLFIYIRKRIRHKKAKRAAEAEGKDLEEKRTKSSEPQEKVIIPPDPAVVLGVGKPGEFVSPEHHEHSLPTPARPSLQGHESEPGRPPNRQYDYAALPNASEANISLPRPLVRAKSEPQDPHPRQA